MMRVRRSDLLRIVAVSVLLCLSMVSIYSGFQTQKDFDQGVRQLENLNEDLGDGSLDNYSESEAYSVFGSSREKMSRGWMTGLYHGLGTGGLVVVLFLLHDWFLERPEEEG